MSTDTSMPESNPAAESEQSADGMGAQSPADSAPEAAGQPESESAAEPLEEPETASAIEEAGDEAEGESEAESPEARERQIGLGPSPTGSLPRVVVVESGQAGQQQLLEEIHSIQEIVAQEDAPQAGPGITAIDIVNTALLAVLLAAVALLLIRSFRPSGGNRPSQEIPPADAPENSATKLSRKRYRIVRRKAKSAAPGHKQYRIRSRIAKVQAAQTPAQPAPQPESPSSGAPEPVEMGYMQADSNYSAANKKPLLLREGGDLFKLYSDNTLGIRIGASGKHSYFFSEGVLDAFECEVPGGDWRSRSYEVAQVLTPATVEKEGATYRILTKGRLRLKS